MATNVTQRNEVLRELLRWHSEKGRLAVNRLFDGVTPPPASGCRVWRAPGAHRIDRPHPLHARLSGRLATCGGVLR